MYFWPKNDDEKWPRKNIFEIPPCAKPFSENLFLLHRKVGFWQNCKFNSVIKMTSFVHGGI